MLNHYVQPVLVNDNIYAQGQSFNGLPVIWNYSIPKNSWSPLPYPKDCVSDRVTLVTYQSRLLVIAAQYEVADYGRRMCKLGNKVLTLNGDGGWEEDVTSPLPDDPLLLNMFACSEGDNLIVAWKKDYRVQLLLYYDHTWKTRDGPDRAIGDHSNIIICDQTVFLTCCEEYPLFHKIPLDELQSAGTPKWVNVQNIPRAHSNLVSLCGRLTITIKLSSSVCVVQYLPASNTWIELGDLDCTFHQIPSVVSVSDTRLLLVGLVQTNPTTERVQFSNPLMMLVPPQVLENFGTLVVDTKGMFA